MRGSPFEAAEVDGELRTVHARLVDPSCRDCDGRLHIDSESLGWFDVDFGSVEGCGHVETMCADCAESWCNDYEVRLDGEAYS